MTRPMVSVGIGFLTAMLAVSFLPLPWVAVAAYLLALLIPLAAVYGKKEKRAGLAAAMLGALAGAVCWAVYLMGSQYDFSALAGQSFSMTGTVLEFHESDGDRCVCRVRSPGRCIEGAPEQFELLLYAPDDPDIRVGSRIRWTGKCQSMRSGPGANPENYYKSQGIRLIQSTNQIKTEGTERIPFGWAKTMNRRLCRTADQCFSPHSAALVKAVLLGEDSGIDRQTRYYYSMAGILHIFSVSGMHVTMLAGFVFFLLRPIPLPGWFRALSACGAAWLFVALTGFGLPAVRAGIMMTVMLAGTAFRRPPDSLNSLFLAAVLILAGNPEAFFAGGFWLSFFAVLGTALFSRPVSERIGRIPGFRSGAGAFAARAVGSSAAANLGILPVTVPMFGGVALMFPLGNLVAVPLLPVISVCGALTLFFRRVPVLGTALAGITEGTLFLVEQTARFLAGFRIGWVGLGWMPGWLWTAAGILMLLAILTGQSRRVTAAVGMGILAVLAGAFCVRGFLDSRSVEITPVLSSGGTSVVVRQGSRASVICLADDGSLGYEIEEYLRARNVWRLEHVVLGGDPPRKMEDTRYLFQTAKPDWIFLGQNELLRYAPSLFPSDERIRVLTPGSGFLLSEYPQGRLDVCRFDEGVLTVVTAGNVRVAIASGDELAERAALMRCEILIYDGKNPEKMRKFPFKYVILLNKSDTAPDAREEEKLSRRLIPAYRRQVSLRVGWKGWVSLR